jgi:hypothetical protein
MLEFMDEASRPAARSLLSIQGIGLACLVMRNDLSRAGGIMFNLDGYGPTQNASRKSAVFEFGRRSNCEAAADAIMAVSAKTRSAMSLARLPIHCLAAQFNGERIEEIKSYVRADRCDERIEGGLIVAERPTTADVSMPILRSCFERHDMLKFDDAVRVLSEMIDNGALLELVGVDGNTSGGSDVKLYFSARPDTTFPGFRPAVAENVVRTALSACGLDGDRADVSDYIRSMIDIGLPCNLIAVGFRNDGKMEAKVYFDAWDTTKERSPIDLCGEDAQRAVRATFETAGIPVCDGDIEHFNHRLQRHALTVDTVSLDVLDGRRGAKVYVRSQLDLGFGVMPNG